MARGAGRVKIVYDDAGIKPENRDVVKQIRDSGVFDRLADRATKTLALPHDLVVKVSDDVPFDDPTTEVDGRTIFWPAGWSNTTRSLLVEFVPDVIRDKGVPKAIGTQNFTPDTLNIWANQFILGHELGHALIHHLTLPLTGMEEDSADGFATFFTIIDKETGPNAALGAAGAFDAFAAKKPNVTMEDFSSDHPRRPTAHLQFPQRRRRKRPQKLENSLVTDGHVPENPRPSLPKRMDAAELRLVEGPRAAHCRHLQGGGGRSSSAGAQGPRRGDTPPCPARSGSCAGSRALDERRSVLFRALEFIKTWISPRMMRASR